MHADASPAPLGIRAAAEIFLKLPPWLGCMKPDETHPRETIREQRSLTYPDNRVVLLLRTCAGKMRDFSYYFARLNISECPDTCLGQQIRFRPMGRPTSGRLEAVRGLICAILSCFSRQKLNISA
eukprot:602369-Amorphochlora_amoeboformis.AAC.1